MNVSQPLARELMRIVIVGHVDHGKSTLVGRLFHDTGSLPDGKFEAIKAMCERRGMPFEWAFLMDAFQSERDQGITIDTAQIWFKTKKRDYTIIDAPGHREFIKNMITGASSAEAALMLIDAGHGIQQQSRLHAFLLSLLGVRQIAVIVNKMDLVDFSADRFAAIRREYTDYLASLGITPSYIIPVAARDGDNIAEKSTRMAWYDGPTLIEALDSFHPAAPLAELPLRLPVQDVYKFDDRRILAGRIASGRLKVGDRLVFSPSNKTARISSIETWSAPPRGEAEAGESVGITLDEQLFIERGEIASHVERAPLESHVFAARLFWLGRAPLEIGHTYRLRLQTREVNVTVERVDGLYDPERFTLNPGGTVARNDIAEVSLRSPALLALDAATDNPKTGRFVLADGGNIVAGGTISLQGIADERAAVTARADNLTAVAHGITTDERARRNGHAGGVLWFTGLSGAGKSTIAMAVERELFRRGYHVFVLDGDNVRRGLSANLGFTPEDRTENIRRIGEVAALFAESGQIVITAFISPYRADRDRARQALAASEAPGGFHEIFIKADISTCERRDPKGLYQKARSGELREFTGISAPYEAPAAPELVVDTDASSVAEAVDSVIAYVEKMFRRGP
ncbi:adenylylsulfate kinase /sulfate adenylyltransferase subunit 1 [Dongia mobilis]|uniref:Adenylyl-sulfate kinase n=1 Tax=Dongia mobilis TaxID=578943 RepID=A0A4R6WSQ0_9PROT|nr:adenylyl-sulfate kinase [Dongia mobilis]TDQ82521.1 adenylylsulfate kinase /sulfate adenylyltransferase subunit 1 [Dongia mobilis]